MNLFPAVLVGGPPHAGKSVLACSVAQKLQSRKCACYLLRAAPDGEGDWASEADQRIVHDIRFKGSWTQRWVDIVCRDLANRPMPLLVDVGGRPTVAQQTIFDQCTHAILLTKNEAEREQWWSYANAHGLTVIADLRSDLMGTDSLETSDPVIRGTLSGLERGQWAKGQAFDALVSKLASIFNNTPDELYHIQLCHAPFIAHSNATHTNVINLEEIVQRLRGNYHFQREDITAVLESIPSDRPVAVYGRAPIWLYVAIAHKRDITWQFDIRLGWVCPPRLQIAQANDPPATNAPVSFVLHDGNLDSNGLRTVTLSVHIGEYYLDYGMTEAIRPPYIPASSHVVLDGRMPLWLATSLAAAYRYCASVDVVQPQERTAINA